MDFTERIIVESALKGDPEAFEMLIQKYGRMLYGHAYSILRHSGDAEDVVQESFIKAYQSRGRIREPEKFPQWLVSAVRNRALDRWRQHKTVPLSDEGCGIPDADGKKPDREVENAEIHEKIHAALSALPERHRTAVALRYLDGMDYESIAKTMGLTNGALRGVLGRALQTMRIRLAPFVSSCGP